MIFVVAAQNRPDKINSIAEVGFQWFHKTAMTMGYVGSREAYSLPARSVIFQPNRKGEPMLYNFEIVKDGTVIQRQAVHLPHIRDAWPTIVRLARRFRERGHRIRVKDQAGGIVILTGVAAVGFTEMARM